MEIRGVFQTVYLEKNDPITGISADVIVRGENVIPATNKAQTMLMSMGMEAVEALFLGDEKTLGEYIFFLDRSVKDRSNLGWEETHTIVVCADTPSEARLLVEEETKSEDAADSWVDPDRSSCCLLGVALGKKKGIVVKHFVS